MKTVEVKEGSWHYWLATFGDRTLHDDQKNVCAYTRKMLWGLVSVSLVALLAAIVAWSVGDFAGYLIACIINFQLIEMYGVTNIGLILALAAIFILSAACIQCLHEEKKLPSLPPIVTAAWESFHDKVCFRIDVKP